MDKRKYKIHKCKIIKIIKTFIFLFFHIKIKILPFKIIKLLQ